MPKKQIEFDTSATKNIDLIEEEITLSPEQQKDLETIYNAATGKFQVGKIIQGKVLSIDSNGVLVDIDYKSNGLISPHEFSEYELKKLIPDNEIEVVIDRLEDDSGSVILSYQKAKSIKAWEKIVELANANEPVRGVITHKVKGGLSVDIGIPAFLPGSQVDIQRVTNFDQYVGQETICKILKINKRRGNVIISRRKYLEEQRLEEKQNALETIQEGQVAQGIVKNITNYGAFVDIGGIDGLLHITDMSWGRIAHPSELVKIGDSITVKVLSFDKKHEKISLGMKQLADNPWEKIGEKYTEGARVKGLVSSITDYGLFIEIEKGVEGLLHISEISWTERVSNLAKHFNVGDEIEALIVALDKDNRRMSLSIKQLSDDPWKTISEKFKEGDKITGTISNITDFGLFVRLADGIDGLVHISDISWTDHVAHPSEKYKVGDMVEGVILYIDPEKRKISLGIKQLENDPWESVAEDYPVGKVIEGTISKITNFGAFVKLPSGIEGLIHISELSDKEVEKVDDIVKVGQTATFKVIKVNKEERKLGLSIKAMKEPAKEEQATPQKKQAERKQEKPRTKASPSKAAIIPASNPLQQALAKHKEALSDEKPQDDE